MASTPRTKVLATSEATSGVGWIAVVGHRQDVGDGIDQKPDHLLADLGDDDDMAHRRLRRREAEAGGEVDDRQDGAAQVDDAAHEGRRLAAATVAGVQPRISRTDMMSTQNSCSPTRNAMSSRMELSCLMVSVMASPCCCKNGFKMARIGVRVGDHGIDVEDQGDAAVAEDRGGGDAGDVAVVRFQALDDDLALALDRVDEQG